ncbi:hypothetical protein [Actinokineospora pegani]|uniref:hypothetical protein n=1 Tax=Actinokineospora pegani TaxID=2654637 RepID=UPI0012E9AACB|nr:hypothetical protein [Actinokineospora pegani]
MPGPGEPPAITWDRARQASGDALDETGLRYKFFLVRAEFIANGVQVISAGDYVPVIDLALVARHALDLLIRSQDASLDFTESAEVIRLSGEGEEVAITSSHHDWRVSVDRNELVAALGDFAGEAYRRVTEYMPDLAENPVLQRLVS